MDLEDGSNRTLSDTNSIKKGNCFHEKDAARTSLPVLEEDSKPKGTTTTSKTTTTTLSPNTTRVYVDMVGDLFHYGHMRFIKQVRQSAETIFPSSRIEIVVGITADKYLADYKRKPCTSNHERAETVEGCKYVDEVIPNVPLTTTDAFMTLHHLDCIFHGDDYTTEQIAKYYGEIDARNAYYSVPYSSNAVSTTMLLRTAANRQAAFLSKLVSGAAAAATTAATTAVPTDTVSGFTFRSYVGPIADESESERLLDLLNLYGPFYKDVFGPDMAWRLLDAGEGQSGLEGRSAWCVAPVDTWGTHNKESTTKNNDNLMMRIVCVSHCCCIFNPVQKKEHCNIGLFGQVITDPRYRRRGLSTTLVGKVLQDWDTNHSDGWLILGTGSPYAANVYQQNGFVHLNGGLDQETKGYNPDDFGEWIMIRQPSSNNHAFNRGQFIAEFYCHDTERDAFDVVPLQRCHWAELCVLFNLDENDECKLISHGIKNGVQIEEKILKLINHHCSQVSLFAKKHSGMPFSTTQTTVGICLDRKRERVHGIFISDGEMETPYMYHLPGMEIVGTILTEARTALYFCKGDTGTI